jgi:hypothetical protein
MAEELAEKMQKENKDDGFGTDHFSLLTSSAQLVKKFKNPFKILYLWCS